ncbi:amidohydrolase family protein [Steroidobacter sp.]|uniref:amidohydrolase family protein n=1 Tax=Steroidobacter sp. TaxID=1978227 RepID=UPI001A43501B|nr:amidohydrolase family protein [Steroidobacter sp.]MBL8268804.1 PD40 domain-containing protein [Steroidobacter sp.]
MKLRSLRERVRAFMWVGVFGLAALAHDCVTMADSVSEAATSRRVQFTTDEGTWMSLDLSPDDRTIVFELAGDLYALPATGGTARQLTHGPAFDAQPRYSPDGRSIAFVSDRSGADNVWIMDVNSGAVRALTQETGAFFVSPEWSPDGEHVVVTKSNRDRGHGREYQLFLYPSSGGAGRQLTTARAEEGASQPLGSPVVLGAAFGADPQRVFAAYRVTPTWPSFAEWQIGVVDRSSGVMTPYTDELNGAMRPLLSRDGRYIVYATQWQRQTRMKLLDMKSREARWLVPDVERELNETAPRRDLQPGAAFTADGSAVVVAHHGKIWRVSVPDGRVTAVPFNAVVDVQLAPLAQFEYPIDESGVSARRIEQAQLSPDRRWLAFSVLGRIWVQNNDPTQSATAPRQISTGTDGAFFPAWSPDGRYLAYVTWNDSDGGAIWRVRMQANAKPERLTVGGDFYEKLAYSGDGRRLVAARSLFQKRFGFFNENRGFGRGDSTELVWLPAGGGEVSVITTIHPVTYWGASSHYGRPHFAKGDAEQLYFADPVDGLVAVRWDGSQRRSLLRIKGPGFYNEELADEMLLSPDARQVIALLNNQLWLVDLPKSEGTVPTIVLPADAATAKARRLSREGADFPQWAADGRSIHWSLGSSFFSQPSTASPSEKPQQRDVTVRVARDTPRGVMVLRGARVITMRADEIIERADVIVTDNRISAIGPQGSVAVPKGARILDVSGKTLLPGYVDIHWHGAPPWGVHRGQVWEFQASLAYGVTSLRDPQPAAMDALTYADRIASGALLGPRFFTTGRGIFLTDGIESLEDARNIARSYAQFYRTETIKDYVTNGDRQVHQWLLAAARELRLTPTAEGNSDFKYSLTRILDGSGGQEHMSAVTPYYQDWVKLVAASGTTITPTLLEGQSGGRGLRQFIQNHDLYSDPKVNRFFPQEEIDYLSTAASKESGDSIYTARELVAQPTAVLAAGGRVALGVHGAIQGLGAHWALWTFVEGGMRAHDALRVGTIMGAQAIGHGRDFGSIEVGKLADLQILDGNPLEDIRQTLSLRYVVINGRVYQTDTLDQIWPQAQPLEPQWWQKQASAR